MSKINNGGPAFPGHPAFNKMDEVATSGSIDEPGMTLRDWFAGKQAAALVVCTMESARLDGKTAKEAADIIAEVSYKVADALLAYRAKGGDA